MSILISQEFFFLFLKEKIKTNHAIIWQKLPQVETTFAHLVCPLFLMSKNCKLIAAPSPLQLSLRGPASWPPLSLTPSFQLSSWSPHSWHDSWIGCIWNSETPFWDRSYTFWPHGGCTFVARAASTSALVGSLTSFAHTKSSNHRLLLQKHISYTSKKTEKTFCKAFHHHHQLFFAR